MSEYHIFDLDFDDIDCLLESLGEMGYKPKVNEIAQPLHGYAGDLRKQKAHIIIPKSQVGMASNDVGFERVKGKYIMHLSEFDQNGFKTNKLKQLYQKSKVTKYIKNTRKLSVKSSEVRKDGSIAIKVRIGV